MNASHIVTVMLLASASTLTADPRIRTVAYASDRIYALQGFVGYQIDLEFAPDESFTGLAAGDIEGLAFTTEANHLFIKPRAPRVRTNLTVLTTHRQYRFDYAASAGLPDPEQEDVIYTLRFEYPPPPLAVTEIPRPPIETVLDAATRPINTDYMYCGHPLLQPVAASDDGVHTRITFSAKSEFPAIFVRNDDGSESLLNFHIEGPEVVVHRVARQLILRRGRLTGCIVNQGFQGTGERLDTGTVSPRIERKRRDSSP